VVSACSLAPPQFLIIPSQFKFPYQLPLPQQPQADPQASRPS
jgi:hypothetical protein